MRTRTTAGTVAALVVAVAATLALVGSDVARAPAAAARSLPARCTNSSGDSAVIASRIAESRPGDQIIFQGTCLIKRTIELRGNRTYRGESRTGTVLREAPNANLPALLASDSYLGNAPKTGDPVSIRELTIDGNAAAGNPDSSGLILRSWLTTVSNVYITGCAVDGIRLSNPSADGSRLQNTSVNGSIIGSMIEDSGRYGVYVEDPGNSLTDWSLLDNYIAGAGVDGIHLENAAGWMIERNHVYGIQQNAISAERLWGTTISDNYLEDFGATPKPGTYYSIRATNQGDESASTISGNRVFEFAGEKNPDSTYVYIGVTQNYGDGALAVTGNVLRGSKGPHGIGLSYQLGKGDSLSVSSTGNLVSDITTPRVVGPGVTIARSY